MGCRCGPKKAKDKKKKKVLDVQILMRSGLLVPGSNDSHKAEKAHRYLSTEGTTTHNMGNETEGAYSSWEDSVL